MVLVYLSGAHFPPQNADAGLLMQRSTGVTYPTFMPLAPIALSTYRHVTFAASDTVLNII
jgi:hypothetical protein